MKLCNSLIKRVILLLLITVVISVLAIILNIRFTNEAKNGLPIPIEKTAISPEKDQAIYSPKQERVNLPVRLKIPSLNLDATVEQVGVLSNGLMDIPKNANDVAWFEPGIRPGEIGSAVIVGHYGWKNKNKPAFDDIHKLQKGDKIYVEDEKGVVITFVVRETRSYDPKANAMEVFISNDGKSHLNLITCEGVWSNILKGYPKRLVVFTDKK